MTDLHIDPQHLQAFQHLPEHLEIGEPRSTQNASVFFLFSRVSPTQVFRVGAADSGLEVSELPEGAQVNRLLFKNEIAHHPLLLRSTDIFSGGKQDRLVDVPALIPRGAQLKVPTLCVEQSRWSARDCPLSESGRFGYAGRLDTELYYERDAPRQHSSRQERVWSGIAERRRGAQLHDLGGSLLETRRASYLDLEHIDCPFGAVGYLVVQRNQRGQAIITLFEYYQDPDACQQAWNLLSDQLPCSSVGRPRVSRTEVRKYLQLFKRAHLQPNERIDQASPYQVSRHQNRGHMLIFKEECVHVSLVSPIAFAA